MSTLREILSKGIDAYAHDIAEKSLHVSQSEKPFNSGIPFSEQIENFKNFSQSEEDAKALLKDSQKFQ
jgi:hypothetical protein